MVERGNVGENQLLLRYIDIVDVGTVYNQTLADADEDVAFDTELQSDHLFDLSQLERQHPHLAIGLYECRIVAVRRDIDDAVGCDAHQIVRRRHYQIFNSLYHFGIKE